MKWCFVACSVISMIWGIQTVGFLLSNLGVFETKRRKIIWVLDRHIKRMTWMGLVVFPEIPNSCNECISALWNLEIKKNLRGTNCEVLSQNGWSNKKNWNNDISIDRNIFNTFMRSWPGHGIMVYMVLKT